MLTRIRINRHQVGLLFRAGDFRRLLVPGSYVVPGRWIGRDQVRTVSRLATEFAHPLLDVMLDDAEVREQLLVVDLAATERALVWKQGCLIRVLGPGRHAFWKRPYDLQVERFDVSGIRFEHPKLAAVFAHPDAKKFFSGVDVDAHEKVLVFKDGAHVHTFGPGSYLFWQDAGRITWRAVDLREQVADVSGQEIMTSDKVTLRVNLVVAFQVDDPAAAASVVSDFAQALYREAQLALRAAVGTRRLEDLLSDKDAVSDEVHHVLQKRAAEFGVVVKSVGLRDVILPGDMKNLLNQVIEAQKQAEANLIRRREETAAARSQANTARLLAENPMLARMRELEVLQQILHGTRATFVVGRGDLLEQLRQMIAQAADEP